jgi:hypothetical protein
VPGGTPQADRIAAELRRAVEKQAIALVLDLVRALMRATPVDTGHARRNWFASIGQPVTEPTAAGGGASNAQVTAYKLEAGPLWVSNPVDYVWFLNYGTSKQAAAGWIETTVMQVLQRAKEKGGSLDVAGIEGAFADTVGGTGAENLASAYSPFGGD